MSDEKPSDLKKPDESPQTPQSQLEDSQEIVDDAPPEMIQRGMRRTMEMFGFQSGPAHNPVLKAVAEHPEILGKFLDHSHSEEQQKTLLNFAIVVIVIVAILAISWLFLSFDQAEHLDAIIGAVIGLLGGFGAGLAYGKSKS